MTNKLRVAVIGCGAIADRLHVPDLAHCDEAEVVALCDKNETHAHSVAEHWVPGAKTYNDYKKMLKEEELDAVIVTLPNVLHCPVTIDCLNAKCHVLVEKPMATSIDECKKMCAAAKKNKKLLMVNQAQRLAPAHLKAKEIIESGILGKILYVTAMFGHEGPEVWSPEGKWFLQKDKARFGAMADLGVHKADLVRHLVGKEIVEITGYIATLEKKATVEDNFVSAIKFSDGTLGMLGASWTLKGLDTNYIMFHCANGSLKVQVEEGRPVLCGLVSPSGVMSFEPTPPILKYKDSWGVDAGGRFARACLGLEKPFCTGEDGMQSLAVIFAAEQSSITGKSVKVPQLYKAKK